MGNVVATVLIAIATLAWILAGWLRIFRLARYFQLEGYENKRYLRWLARNEPERRYTRVSLVANALIAVLFIIPLVCSNAFLREGEYTVSSNIWLWGATVLVTANIVLAVVLTRIRLLEREIKQGLTPTQRATRLIITTFVLASAPGILSLLFLIRVYQATSYDEALTGIVPAAFSLALVSLLSFHLAPLYLPLANAINWPIENSGRIVDTFLGGKR
jgi:hypothetical protein